MTQRYVSEAISKLAIVRGLNVVLTGGPSVGKSTIAERMKAMGFIVREEMASVLIQQAKRFLAAHNLGEPRNDPALVKLFAEHGLFHPMVNNAEFQDALCAKQLEQEAPFVGRSTPGRVVFDRALPDNYAYCDYYGVEVPEKYRNLDPAPAERYDVCLVLESFNKFVDNGIRVEKVESGADFAKLIGPRLGSKYRELGVYTIDVPAFSHEIAEVSIQARMDFIWKQLHDYAEQIIPSLNAA